MNREQYTRIIKEHGHQIIGVIGEDDIPSFAYTIGLTAQFGFELFMAGVRAEYAAQIINDLAKDLPLVFGVSNLGYANMPLMLKACDFNLDKLHLDFVRQADDFYGKRVQVVQILMCDREGNLPGQVGYDAAYMNKFQPLFCKV